MADDPIVGVECGQCGGPIYFLTCPEDDCDFAIASECQGECKAIHPIMCPIHDGAPYV